MKNAILAAAHVIRNLERAHFHFEVSAPCHALHPLFAPDPDNCTAASIRIRLPDHPANAFQPSTAVLILLAPDDTVPNVQVLNLLSRKSPNSAAAQHTLALFRNRLKRHGAQFPMNIAN